MATINSMPSQAAASRMASAAKGGGTKIIAVLAPVASTASETVSKIGTPSDLGAPLAGGDPGDQVGAVVAVAEGVEPALPAGQALDDQSGRFVDVDRHLRPLPPARRPSRRPRAWWRPGTTESDAASAEDRPALVGVGPVEADHDRPRQVEALQRLDDALGHQVAAGDAAEDVDQHRPHRRILGEHVESVADGVGPGAAADVEEVGGRPADQRHHVERGHDQAGPVADDADRRRRV